MNDAPYLDAIRRQAVRTLGRLDRERFSRTYGCMDRTFWAWKFIDFPGARFQEGLCALSYLWATPFADSEYHGSERLLEWIAGGIDFWSGIQRRAGDFDEAYPLERSLAATAFTSFYLSEAYLLVGDALPAETAARFRAALARAGGWLTRNDESHGFLSNHLAAAAAALQHAARITGEARFEARARHFTDKILDHQSDEGWYDEYGGADPGYQTHGSFYLARILELDGDPALADSLERSFEFLAHFVHPDRSIGGEYASRNTQTYYPAAFEMRAHASGRARWIAEQMRPAVESLSAAGLGSVDAWNLFPLLNNYVFAHRASAVRTDLPEAQGPSEEPGIHHFRKAGILKVRRPAYDLYVATGKGGVAKLFERSGGTLVASDCGYLGRLRGGQVISSQWLQADAAEVGEGAIRVETSFFAISRPFMDPLRFLGFRLFSLTLGRIPRAATWLKALLVRVLIYRKREVPLRLVREIELGEDGIAIRDALRGPIEGVEELVQADVFTTIHMGSSRYFVPNDLRSCAPTDPVEPGALGQGVARERSIPVRGQ